MKPLLYSTLLRAVNFRIRFFLKGTSEMVYCKKIFTLLNLYTWSLNVNQVPSKCRDNMQIYLLTTSYDVPLINLILQIKIQLIQLPSKVISNSMGNEMGFNFHINAVVSWRSWRFVLYAQPLTNRSAVYSMFIAFISQRMCFFTLP